MNTYDIDKVSPRPWRVIEMEYQTVMRDANGRCLYETHGNSNYAHIVQCVNTHDALMDLARAVQKAYDETLEGEGAIVEPFIVALDALRDAGVEI